MKNRWKNIKFATKLKAMTLFLCGFVTVWGVVGIVVINSSARMAESLEILQNEAYEVAQAATYHLIWRQELTEAVLAGTKFRGSLDSRSCALGKWLDKDCANMVNDEKILSLKEDIVAPHEFIHREAHTLIILSAEDARKNFFDVFLLETQKVTDIMMQIEARYLELVHDKIETIAANGRIMFATVIIFVLSIVIGSVFLYAGLGRMIKPIRGITEDALKIADGNFAITHEYGNSDEIGLLSKSFKKITASLSKLSADINRMYEEQQKGNYQYLVESGAYEGAYADIAAHINELIKSLIKAKTDADTANQAKSAFLNTMSHEIRTPMNAILGITEILIRDETISRSVNEGLSKIRDSGDLLLNIINDILDLSKIEAAKLELDLYKYETASLINDNVMLNMMRIGSMPIEFRLFVDENMPSFMIGDELRIKQILNNLLSNAFKYTKRGEVRLSFTIVKKGEGEESGLTLIFSVSDTGLGMTQEQVNAMFDEYSRFHFKANRTTEGTGLGMSIVRNLVKLMNGEINVKSELGKGTIVTVRLPQGYVTPDTLGKELAQNLQNFQFSGMRQIQKALMVYEPMPYGSVLIVDDVESNSFVAKGLMAPYRMRVDTAQSGFEAIDNIKNGKIYDIIFMDHMMPKMDGLEATKIIREHGYTHPIVALTANAVSGQRDMFMANGFDEFISKPIDIRRLNDVLKKFIRDKQPPEIIKAALEQMKDSVSQAAQAAQPQASMQLVDFFINDAVRAAAELEALFEKRESLQDEDINAYTTNVHAMKSALVNVGELELSAFAKRLEQAGRVKNIAVISAQTPTFINELKSVIAKFTRQMRDDSTEIIDADYAYMREKMFVFKKACEEYDKKTAKNIIIELRKRRWPLSVSKQLGSMAEKLMSGDFDEVSVDADRIIDIV